MNMDIIFIYIMFFAAALGPSLLFYYWVYKYNKGKSKTILIGSAGVAIFTSITRIFAGLLFGMENVSGAIGSKELIFTLLFPIVYSIIIFKVFEKKN